MAEQRPSTMVEDYLKVIWKAEEWLEPDDGASTISTSEIASTLGVTASSVSGNLKKLARDGLIDYAPYGTIGLTEAGRTIALSIVRRHRLLETYLAERLGFAWDEVHAEAEILEHAVSDRLLDRIDEVLGHPTQDPHGDPIPGQDGTIVRPSAARLTTVDPQYCGYIVRISDHEPEILRYLDERELRVGSHLRVDDHLAAVGALRVVRIDPDGSPTAPLEIAAAAADAVWTSTDPHEH